MTKAELARKALIDALALRIANGIPLTDSVSIFDLSEKIGIREVRFVPIPSLEELYWKDEKRIFVSSLRPGGRQRYSCAHGLGHHHYGHGTCIMSVEQAEQSASKFQPDEFLAEVFAGFLLMPKSTVLSGFNSRGWKHVSCNPLQVMAVSSWLGVGYSALIRHMTSSLSLISADYAKRLLAVGPAKIKQHLFGSAVKGDLILVDEEWSGRPIDLQVGDTAILPSGTEFEGESIATGIIPRNGMSIVGIRPGISQVRFPSSGKVQPVRVARKEFQGRNCFRFDEDPDYENEPTADSGRKLIASLG